VTSNQALMVWLEVALLLLGIATKCQRQKYQGKTEHFRMTLGWMMTGTE